MRSLLRTTHGARCARGAARLALAALGALGGCSAKAADVPHNGPRTLNDCYLQAMQKPTADLGYLAKELCEAVFRRTPTSLVVFEQKAGQCVEWWFDARGRYESPSAYCALTQPGEGRLELACQWKTPSSELTYVELRAVDGRLEPVAPLRGRDPGPIFTDLGACVRHRTAPAQTLAR